MMYEYSDERDIWFYIVRCLFLNFLSTVLPMYQVFPCKKLDSLILPKLPLE
jgi:hypothetical protein